MHMELLWSVSSYVKVCAFYFINVKEVGPTSVSRTDTIYCCILLVKEETSRSRLEDLTVVDYYHYCRFIWGRGGGGYIQEDGSNIIQKYPIDRPREIHISLMKEECMDDYLVYDLALTTSCGMANVLAF